MSGYKETAVGRIPEGWEVRTVGEITVITSGGTPDTKNEEFWEPHEIPWMSSGEVHKKRVFKTDNLISTLGMNSSSAKLIPVKSVVIALAGQGKTRGTVAITEIELTTNQSLGAILPSDHFISEFLFHNLDSRYGELRRMSSGDGGRGGLNLSILRSIIIPLPPLPEQQKIAEILTTVDEKIAVVDEEITAVTTLKTGLMQKLFSEGIGHSAFKDSPIGRIPEGWEVRTLVEVADYVDYRGKTPTKTESGTLLLTAKNIKLGKIDYECSKEYVATSEYAEIMSRGLPKIGDVVFTTEAPCGNVAQLDREDVAIAQRVIKYRGKDGILENRYLLYSFLSPAVSENIDKEATGSTVKGIKGSRLHKIEIPLPPLPEQQKIAEILTTVDDKLSVLQEKKASFTELKKGLMQKLLTGEIRVMVDK